MIKKQLTDKQERFCREYVVCMNLSQAYRKAYSTKNMKSESVNNLAYRLNKNVDIMSRIEELKKDIEAALGFNKLTLVKDLLAVKDRALQFEAVTVYDKVEQRMSDKLIHLQIDGVEDQIVGAFEFDAAGATRAVQQISKMMGYDAPTKIEGELEITNIVKKIGE